MIIDAGAGSKSRFFGFNQSGTPIPIDLICVRAMRAHTDEIIFGEFYDIILCVQNRRSLQ